jgi:hypothetical protein
MKFGYQQGKIIRITILLLLIFVKNNIRKFPIKK